MIGTGVGVNVGDGGGVGVPVAVAVGAGGVTVGMGLDVGVSEAAAAVKMGVVPASWRGGVGLATATMANGVEALWVVAVGDTWVLTTSGTVG